MSDTLYRYYEEELVGFHQRASDFSQKYPSAAGQLRLDPTQSADPHVERLIQSFSFLNARIRKKLDDDFPELTDALLSILYPHYIAPIPSMATIQFEPESSNLQSNGLTIERHSGLHTEPINGVPCRFRTCYPVELWPVELVESRLFTAPFPESMRLPEGAKAALSITLKSTGGMSFDSLSLEDLRLHLNGDSNFTAKLYELIFNQTVSVEFRSKQDDSNSFELAPEDCIRPVGFGPNDSILPYPKNSFVGYQLLTELFTFPQKFAYVDLGGFQRVAAQNMGRSIEIRFYLKEVPARMESELTVDAFKLGCTPVVNLFERICEPIQLSYKKSKYRVTPDVHHPQGFEIHTIDEVKSADPHNQRTYHPFYSFQKPIDENASDSFWYASRNASHSANDDGSDVSLHLVDPGFDPCVPAEAALTVYATCTNRDLPIQLQHSRSQRKFNLEAAIPLQSIRCLGHPTTPLRTPMRRMAHWKLISHLTLNHLSIADSDDSLDSLKQMLRLYDFSDRDSSSKLTAVNRQMVEGITGIKSRRVTRRLGSSSDGAFCRGMQIEMNLDEEKYIGIGAFLFASVMRQFFTKYASINSFVELLVTTDQRELPLRHWAPLVGEERVI